MDQLLIKPVKECSDEELDAIYGDVVREMKRRVFERLEDVAEQYIGVYGVKTGVEQMGEDLCKRIADGRHPDGWSGLMRHLVKISG